MTSTFSSPRPLQTAVLFLVFNRPDTTSRVFEAIRESKTPRLYVAADGPRLEYEGEAERVDKVRKIATTIDWPCKVRTLFRDSNVGCKSAVSEAISWFFAQEDQGIILEDDCLPSQSFFWFCEYNLNFYKHEKKVFSINGSNYLPSISKTSIKSTYIFADPDVWGWATWKDRWQYYDDSKTAIIHNMLSKSYLHFSLRHLLYAQDIALNALRSAIGKISSWAYPWTLTVLSQGGLSVTPRISLVENIGFGDFATHTKNLCYDFKASGDISSFEISQANPKVSMSHWYLHEIHKRSLINSIRQFILLVFNLLYCARKS